MSRGLPAHTHKLNFCRTAQSVGSKFFDASFRFNAIDGSEEAAARAGADAAWRDRDRQVAFSCAGSMNGAGLSVDRRNSIDCVEELDEATRSATPLLCQSPR